MSVTGGAVPKNAKRSASLVRKVLEPSSAFSKRQNSSLSKSASATMMHHMKSSLSSSTSSFTHSEKIVEASPATSRQGSADSGIGKEEPIKESDDEKFNLPPRITTYSE